MVRSKLEADIELPDGGVDTLSVTIDGRDIVAWEQRTGQSFIGKKMSYGLLVSMAGLAASRLGLWESPQEEWESRCVEIRRIDDAEEAAANSRPTRRGRSVRSA